MNILFPSVFRTPSKDPHFAVAKRATNVFSLGRRVKFDALAERS